MYHFIPTLSSLDNLLLTESNPSLEVTVLAQGRRDKNYKGRIQIKVYLTQKTGLLTTMLGLCKNSRITSLDYLICFRQNAAFKYHFIRCTFTKATECTSLMISHCSILLLAATHNESGIFSHGFQLDVLFINRLWYGCQ